MGDDYGDRSVGRGKTTGRFPILVDCKGRGSREEAEEGDSAWRFRWEFFIESLLLSKLEIALKHLLNLPTTLRFVPTFFVPIMSVILRFF
jgi:hypothetical protein